MGDFIRELMLPLVDAGCGWCLLCGAAAEQALAVQASAF